MQNHSLVSSINEDPHPVQTFQANTASIKPLPHCHLNHKNLILDEKRFRKSLVNHLKTSKSASFDTSYGANIHHRIKEYQKVLKAQGKLSKVHLSLDTRKNFQNKLLSTIQNFSSLSSLGLKLSGHFKSIQGILFKSLASSKRVRSLDIILSFLSIKNPKTLKKLTETIRKSRKLFSLSLTIASSNGPGLSYPNSLLSHSLRKITHLRTLKLKFEYSRDSLFFDIDAFTYVLPKFLLLTQIEVTFGIGRTLPEHILLTLLKTFQRMKSLSDLTLDFRGCEFAKYGDPILESFKCLVGTSIQKLNLGLFQNFSNRNLEEFSQVLKELLHLKGLCLNFDLNCVLYDGAMTKFGSVLACLTSLTHLTLHFMPCQTHENIVQSIAPALISLQDLVFLKFEFYYFDGTEDFHFQMLFSNLKALRCLRYLHIAIIEQNTMTDTSLEALGGSLKELNLLKSLSLELRSVPCITEKGVAAISSGIQEGPSNLFSLYLNFTHNVKLGEKAINKIGEALKSLLDLYSV